MFNDKCRLTQAVLNGRKTITRRIVPEQILKKVEEYQDEYYNAALETISEKDAILSMATYEYRNRYPQISEVVAIAQSYNDIIQEAFDKGHKSFSFNAKDIIGAGCNNKMFVKADLMPHHIRITNIRVERLQDISNEDCLREGISQAFNNVYSFIIEGKKRHVMLYETPKDAFSILIDKVSGKGTWERNPYVFVYEFELIN